HLRSSIVHSVPLAEVYDHLPYHAIHHTLCEVWSMALWVRRKDTKTYKTLSMEYFTRKTRVQIDEYLKQADAI
ncbi:hypothetical protein HAX54_021421, partial [Datura stramonium]|nr:hypothetical protein [Datura stramonium]